MLPTFLAASGLQLHQDLIISLTGFVVIYTSLAVVDVYLLRKVILKGPDDVPGRRATPQPRRHAAGGCFVDRGLTGARAWTRFLSTTKPCA